jgi:hypothetical protein
MNYRNGMIHQQANIMVILFRRVAGNGGRIRGEEGGVLILFGFDSDGSTVVFL